MERKIQKRLTYTGFGLPILLINVPMIKVFGKWAIDVKINQLELVVLYHILRKPSLLNKEEIKFIRKFLYMTTTEFGKIFGVTHPTVLKWESGESHISATSDVYLRLYVLNHLRVKDSEFRNMYSTVNLEELIKNKGEKTPPISINIDEDLKTA